MAALAVPVRTDFGKFVGRLEQLAGDVIMKSKREALGVVRQRGRRVGPCEHSTMGSKFVGVELSSAFYKSGACAR